MDMNNPLHSLDLQYAALADDQIELMWRHAVVHDPDAREPLLRQLVLRASVVLDETCRREGERSGFTDADHERAYSESAQRLMSRLRVDPEVHDIRALAHQLACEVISDRSRRRAPRQRRFAVSARPQLHLVPRNDPR